MGDGEDEMAAWSQEYRYLSADERRLYRLQFPDHGVEAADAGHWSGWYDFQEAGILRDEQVAQLCGMGFNDESRTRRALDEAAGDMEEALQRLENRVPWGSGTKDKM